MPQENRYYARMRSSLGDKVRMLPFVNPDAPVLDIGCADGALMSALLAEGFDAYGIDMDPAQAPVEIQDRIQRAYADEIHPSRRYGTILCSSVLHEVFSYGNRSGKLGRLSNLSDAFYAFKDALEPGGRLVLRDGVRPDPNPVISLPVESAALVRRYLAESPFTADDKDRNINLSLSHDEKLICGSLGDVMEYAFTATWGMDGWVREVREYYGVFSRQGWIDFVESHGFTCSYAKAYRQQGYVDHMTAVEFGNIFPDTNVVLSFTKS